MKKTLLCLFAFLLSVTAMNAQKATFGQKATVGIASKKVTGQRPVKQKAPSAPFRIQLDAGERIMGYYDTDDLDLSGYSSLGLSAPSGRIRVGGIFESGKFAGGQMTKMRFAVAESVGSSNVAIYTVDMTTGAISDQPVLSQDVASTVQGWNDVTLSTPITIEANKGYLVTYDYQQTSRGNALTGYQAVNYPVLVDYMVNPDGEDPNGFLIYGDLGDGIGWYTMSGAGYGNVCVQAVVKGGSFIDDDVALSNLSLSKKFYKNGDAVDYSFKIKNDGKNQPTSYTLNVAVDGKVVSTLNTPVALTGSNQTYNGTFNVSGLSAGGHDLTVSVTDINGTVPTQNINDDKISANLGYYTTAFPRQMNLIEQCTSTYCRYCPYGIALIEAIQNMRNDVAVVGIHNSMMGPDPLLTNAGEELADVLAGAGLPSAAFNRYYVSDATINSYGTLGVTIGYQEAYIQQAALLFNQEVIDASMEDIPAFATVDIASYYNESTRQLTVTVSGEAVEGFNGLFNNDPALTVYLTEDGVVSPQLQPTGTWQGDAVHDNVLRDVVTETWGDALTWTDDTHYSNTFTVTLDDEWVPENMHIVAAVGRHYTGNNSIDDVWVSNANTAKIGYATSGISNPGVTEDGATEVARYSLDGTRLSAPVKGVNLVKMSDGTVKKVMVK